MYIFSRVPYSVLLMSETYPHLVPVPVIKMLKIMLRNLVPEEIKSLIKLAKQLPSIDILCTGGHIPPEATEVQQRAPFGQAAWSSQGLDRQVPVSAVKRDHGFNPRLVGNATGRIIILPSPGGTLKEGRTTVELGRRGPAGLSARWLRPGHGGRQEFPG